MPATPLMPENETGNRRILAVLGFVVIGMVGLDYASVPLYQLICQVTGYGGTTQVTSDAAVEVVAGHQVKVRFDANTNPSLKWRF